MTRFGILYLKVSMATSVYGLMHTLVVLTTRSNGIGLTTDNLPASTHTNSDSTLKLFDFLLLIFLPAVPVLGESEIRHCSLVHSFAKF